MEIRIEEKNVLIRCSEFRFDYEEDDIKFTEGELTKFVIAHPFPKKDTKSVAKRNVKQIILKFGHLKVLKSERVIEFINELLNNMWELSNIKQIFSTRYHHHALGSVERNHKVLNQFSLACTIHDSWDKWTPYYCLHTILHHT